jgi:flagellar export protein FliJ
MKKFSFTLQSVLHLKQDLEENEKMILSSLERKRVELQNALITLESMHLQTVNAREAAASAGISSARFAEYSHYLQELDDLIAAKQIEIVDQDIIIAEQREVLTELRKEIKTLERLRENQFKEYSAAQDRQSEILIEDFISGRRVEQSGS